MVREIATPVSFTLNEQKLEQLGITRRELEILTLIAAGLSNREIAHSSRVFDKLGARRRTQAVQLGKEFGLIP